LHAQRPGRSPARGQLAPAAGPGPVPWIPVLGRFINRQSDRLLVQLTPEERRRLGQRGRECFEQRLERESCSTG
jgi:hypothetical protein